MRVRPLRRVGPGVWKSRDPGWTFLRHMDDPHPQRWYAYWADNEDAANLGNGETTLGEVADFAEKIEVEDA